MSESDRRSLDQVFLANLSSPQVVFDAKNVGIVYAWNSWTTVRFQQEFPLSGGRSLVIDLQKSIKSQVQSMEWASQLIPAQSLIQRMPTARATFGPLGTGASTALLADRISDPIKIRLLVKGSPTMTVESTPKGNVANPVVFSLGSSFKLSVHGMSGNHFVQYLGLGIGQPAPLLGGTLWLASPMFPLAAGVINSSGRADRQFAIPNIGGLVGAEIAVQGATTNPSRSLALISNAVAFPIQR